MKFDLRNPLTGENDLVSALFATESDHMPSFLNFKPNDIRYSIRHHSFSLISQAQLPYNIDKFTTYLAVNYIDRFLSKQVVLEIKPWIVRILAIASLSLAAKMRSINLSLSDIQSDGCLIFDAQSVHRMELMILATLDWRSRSITPFAFLHFFSNLLSELMNDFSPSQSLASHIIFTSHYEIKLLQYRPSTLAASALLCAAHELIPCQFSICFDAFSKCQLLNKEELLNCWNVMRDAAPMDQMCSSALTPKSVLHQQQTSPENADRNNRKRPRLTIKCSNRAVRRNLVDSVKML